MLKASGNTNSNRESEKDTRRFSLKIMSFLPKGIKNETNIYAVSLIAFLFLMPLLIILIVFIDEI